MDEQRGRQLTNAESELVGRQDLYEFDEDLLNEIADYFTGPYEREITVVCESCGSVGTMIEKMPAGYMRLGIPHALCAKCIRKRLRSD